MVAVVLVLDELAPRPASEVVHDLVAGSVASATAAADLLNSFDVLIVQHGYGITAAPTDTTSYRFLKPCTHRRSRSCLIHGVGPTREHAIDAIVLDLEHPERLIAALPEPLLVADESEREGYVPNVVYSCGPMIHGNNIVPSYGRSDSSVRIAMVNLSLLLERLTRA